MKVAVTGASGFVGHSLCSHLRMAGHDVIPIVRRDCGIAGEVNLPIGDDNAWQSALRECESVVHLAGRAHVMQEKEVDPLAAFMRVNSDATIQLAMRAHAAGVRRLVFVSTVKVNGESTQPGIPFRPEDPPNPMDPYAHSKWAAEVALQQFASESGLEVVIVRPPLVYGPGVKGNFASMIRWVQKGWPLPLGAIENRRSLIGLQNLTDFLALCADAKKSPAAANQTFLISDGEAISTTRLLRMVAQSHGKRLVLLPVPPFLLRLAASIFGKRDAVERLLGSLEVDDSKSRQLLGWYPATDMSRQLRQMVWSPNEASI